MKLAFNIRTVPFSRYGSFLAVSWLPARPGQEEGVYIRTVRGGDTTAGAAFRIELVRDGESLAFTSRATPGLLELESGDGGRVELCIDAADRIRLRARHVGLRLTLAGGDYDYAMERPEGRWEVNDFRNEVRFMLTPLQGTLSMDAPWRRTRCEYIAAAMQPDGSEAAELLIQEYRTVWEKPAALPPFADSVARTEAEFAAWLGKTPAVPSAYEDGRLLAAYITWSCVVPADGYLPRPAMYMSKNWMTNIWSWDHCFNAMALIREQPALAWDQFMIFFDRQDKSGALPDFMNDKYALWNCCKPPIHGWTLSWMMERSEWIGPEQLQEVYGPLSRWTEWWFRYGDDDGDGMPQYSHGNDSGWDNSTIFHDPGAVESPDLGAYLVLQCDALAEIARRLERPEEAAAWNRRADGTLERMLAHCWRDGRMTAVRAGTHEPVGEDSLIACLPLVLGRRLPQEIRAALVQALADERRFFTPHGFATESIGSPAYEPDGYWRGPIWAPVMMLLVDGLLRCGEEELAREAARRFCDMAARSGMAENFDALTGEGLRDRAFTWTSSVFLMLAHEYAWPRSE
ncbi:trehalase family glycosidase [Paenibacillus dendritiformis]|uniref:amylo-alpha-1,6-glucosidase n=1 Tax=Paenibacillus dendritiformis TaxID=130049 RepID=UPI00248AC4AD|nr:trehalase family glycosidase [Paenibacillus dendritiformis]WGU96923.1 trehalase family glycosidase [Paenibacillus dendritiformis]